MRINSFFIFLIFFSLHLSGCGDRWNNETKKNFKLECEATDNVESIIINLEGYAPKEIDSILIKYISNKMTIDSFFVHPIRDKFNAFINIEGANKIKYKNNIEIHIKGESPHIISGLKNEVVPQFTNSGEGYGCELTQLYLDGKYTTKNDLDFLTIRKIKESIYKVKHEVLPWTEEEKKARAFTKPIPLVISSSKLEGNRLVVTVSGVMGACGLIGSIEFPLNNTYNLIYEIDKNMGMAKHLAKHKLTYSIIVPDTTINYNLNLFYAETNY